MLKENETAIFAEGYACLRLNGPNPSMVHNSEMLKTALIKMKAKIMENIFNTTFLLNDVQRVNKSNPAKTEMFFLGGDK